MSEVIGWGVGVVLVGCLRTPHHAQTPVNKGLPRDLGGVLGVWLTYPYSKECSVSNNANRGILYTRSVTLVMCTHYSAEHSQ